MASTCNRVVAHHHTGGVSFEGLGRRNGDTGALPARDVADNPLILHISQLNGRSGEPTGLSPVAGQPEPLFGPGVPSALSGVEHSGQLPQGDIGTWIAVPLSN